MPWYGTAGALVGEVRVITGAPATLAIADCWKTQDDTRLAITLRIVGSNGDQVFLEDLEYIFDLRVVGLNPEGVDGVRLKIDLNENGEPRLTKVEEHIYDAAMSLS